MSHYYQMIDFYLQKKKKQTLKGYFKGEIGLKILNNEQKSYYNVGIEVFRSTIRLKFKNKGYLTCQSSNVDVLPSQRLFLKHKFSQFQIDLINVKAIILKVDSFLLVSKDSNFTTSFYSNDPKFKNELVDLIRTNSLKYLGHKISLATSEDFNHLVVSF